MNLWIRSQDKELLRKVDLVYIRISDFKYKIEDGEVLLGEYKTKERVIQILDEIQNLIHSKLIIQEKFPSNKRMFECEELRMNYKYPNNEFIFVHDGFEVKKISDDIVYEMPEE